MTSVNKPEETIFSLRDPPYAYLHLHLHSSKARSNNSPLDAITLRSVLNSALQTYLGLTGTAISIDILKVEADAGEAWVRIQRDDERAVIAALSQWVGRGGDVLRVLGRGSWLGALTAQHSAGLWELGT